MHRPALFPYLPSMRTLYTFILCIIGIGLSAQSNHTISAYYGLIQTDLVRSETLDGGGGYSNKNSSEVGLRYAYSFTESFALETGFGILNSTVEISSEFPGVETREEELQLISIPVIATYSFSPYFYVNGGMTFDFQSDDMISYDDQSGIGFSLGIGTKLYYKNLFFNLNPLLELHSAIPFQKENYHQRLLEGGILLGIGYEF